MRWAHWSSSWPTWSPNGCFDHWMWFFHIFPLFSLITWGLGFYNDPSNFFCAIISLNCWSILSQDLHQHGEQEHWWHRWVLQRIRLRIPMQTVASFQFIFWEELICPIFFMIFGTIWFLQPTSRSGSRSYTTKVDTLKSKRLGPSSLVLQRSLVDVHWFASSRTSLDCCASGIKSTKHSSVWRAMGTIMQRNLFQFQRTFCQSKKIFVSFNSLFQMFIHPWSFLPWGTGVPYY